VTEGVPTRHQFYGRRSGKPLRRNHAELMEKLLPQVAVDLTQPLAGTESPRWLEVGFGGGEHLAHQAVLHPDVSVVGAEAFRNGVAKLLALMAADTITNLKVHYGDARALLEVLPDQCLERIYLLYPDPWPKERQKKRRFVSAQNLQHFERLLLPGGLFFFASDIPDYVDWTLHHVAEHSRFSCLSQSGEPFENWRRTRYEAKALREGRTASYLVFRKPDEGRSAG
jgi:tRNA (guanine-N7-)-methyltransferase